MQTISQPAGVLPVAEYNRQQQAQWQKDYDKAAYPNLPQLAFYLYLNQRTLKPLKTGYVAWRGKTSALGKTKAEALDKLGPEPAAKPEQPIIGYQLRNAAGEQPLDHMPWQVVPFSVAVAYSQQHAGQYVATPVREGDVFEPVLLAQLP